jgi:hypothetical protein
MTISVRLDEFTERALAQAAATRGMSKSDLIRQCLSEFLTRHGTQSQPWELGVDLFGQVGSGRTDLSKNRKALVREKIHARQNRR